MNETVKIAKDCYLPREQIKMMIAYAPNSLKQRIRKMRTEGSVLDLCGGRKILTAVFLVSGEVILVNTSVDTINMRYSTKGE